MPRRASYQGISKEQALREKAFRHAILSQQSLIKARRVARQKAANNAVRKAAVKNAVPKKPSVHKTKSLSAHSKLAYRELCEKLKNENTVNSLKVLAEANGLTGYSSMRKDELCAAIGRAIMH